MGRLAAGTPRTSEATNLRFTRNLVDGVRLGTVIGRAAARWALRRLVRSPRGNGDRDACLSMPRGSRSGSPTPAKPTGMRSTPPRAGVAEQVVAGDSKDGRKERQINAFSMRRLR